MNLASIVVVAVVLGLVVLALVRVFRKGKPCEGSCGGKCSRCRCCG